MDHRFFNHDYTQGKLFPLALPPPPPETRTIFKASLYMCVCKHVRVVDERMMLEMELVLYVVVNT